MPTTFITADTTTNTTIGSSYNVILLHGVTADGPWFHASFRSMISIW